MSTAFVDDKIDDKRKSFGVSREADKIAQDYRTIITSYSEGAVSNSESFEQKFYRLLDAWRRDTEHISSVSAMILHPAYQQIIGMGTQVVPLLLKELQERPDYLFWALEAVTGVNPVVNFQLGNFDEMTKEWLHWGRMSGII